MVDNIAVELLHSLKAFDASSDSFMSVESVQQLAVNYRMHIDEVMLPSQTAAPAAAAFLRSRFSDVMVNRDMNDILSAWNHCQWHTRKSQSMPGLRIAMTIPVTTAGNERFFSVLKIVKTYLRSAK